MLGRPARALAVVLTLCVPPAALAQGTARSKKDDLARARVLDEQGVRAYKESRYNDAILLFYEAYRLGGPPSELWNVAKCHLKLDQPEEANDVIEQYLTLPGLSEDDKKEAQAQLQELRTRPSTLTVTSNPAGALVTVDGRRTDGTSRTPISVRVQPGTHTVALDLQNHAPVSKEFEARFGRAVVVDVEMTRTRPDAPPSPPPQNPYGDSRRFGFMGEFGVLFPKYGDLGDAGGPAGLFRATYALTNAATAFTIGWRLTVVGDGWSNTLGVPNASTNCGAPVGSSFSGTALSVFGTAGVDRKVSERWRLGADAGLGIAAFFSSQVGGDLFITSCRPSPGVKPALHFGLEASYAMSSAFRFVLSPLVFELNPAFEGTRAAPRNASALWYRAGFALGVSVDL
jgi:hypothetical protein